LKNIPSFHDYVAVTVSSQHYLNLQPFPYYLADNASQNYSVEQLTGASCSQMVLNYLWWNQTADPGSEPSDPQFPDQGALFENFTTGQFISGDEMWQGFNEFMPQPGFGYFFNPSFSSREEGILLRICCWLDYPVDYYSSGVPVEGYPVHVPVVVPTGGNYSHWMVIKGLHTNQPTWPPGDVEDLVVYGFWVNDPLPCGLGGEKYITVETWMNEYCF
jgi:hypothetical protein